MTETQFDRLLALLEKAFAWSVNHFELEEPRGHLYKPEDFKSGAESLKDALPGLFQPGPIPEPKRKRGRPRLTPEQKQERANKEIKSHEQTSYTCPYCHRILPAGVRELHEPNCRAGAQGYASHEAAPGQRR